MKKPIVLKNGLRVHLIPVAGTQAATVLVLVKVGSRYEYQAINGASHFIEHLMFKGTKRRPTTLHISRVLDVCGAEYNAFTGKEYTGYYITIEAGKVPLAIDLLHDMLVHSHFDPREMNKERNVIIEEIKMYNENPMMHVEEMLEQVMFPGSTLGWDIAGDKERMKSMTRKQVLAYRDAHYVPSNMVVAVAGKIDKSVLGLIEKTFGRMNTVDHALTYESYVPPEASAVPRTLVQNKPLEQVQLAMGFPSFDVHDKRNTVVSLLATILGGTMSSRLFVNVREKKGLCYFVRAENSPYDDTGLFMIRSGLDRARIKEATQTILSECERMVKNGVTPQELREAKEHIRGRLLLRLEESSAQADWFARQDLLMGEVLTLEEKMAKLKRVTVNEVQQVAKMIFDRTRMSIAVIGPFENEQVFLKEAGF